MMMHRPKMVQMYYRSKSVAKINRTHVAKIVMMEHCSRIETLRIFTFLILLDAE